MSCSDDSSKAAPSVTISRDNANFTNQQSTLEVDFSSNIESLSAVVALDGRDWCEATLIQSEKLQKLSVVVQENQGFESRTTQIELHGEGQRATLNVTQLGLRAQILVSHSSMLLNFRDTVVVVEATANCPYNIEINSGDEWITLQQTFEMVATKHNFQFSRNTLNQMRTATIRFAQDGGDAQAALSVQQQRQPAYSGGDAASIDGDILLKVVGGSASSFQPGSGIENTYDGDMSSIYHSSWSNSSDSYFPITLEYFLEEGTPSLDYLVYYPRTEGDNGHIKLVNIYVATQENPSYQLVGEKDFLGSSEPKRVDMGGVLHPTKVKFEVLSGSGDGNGFAACSQMQFYRSNPLAFNPLTLFVDRACSALKPGITQSDIDQTSSSFFKNMAQYMFDGSYPMEFRIADYKPYEHPDVQAKKNKTSPYSLMDNPTGIFFSQNEEVVILVEAKSNNLSLSIQVQDLKDGYGGVSYPLSVGVNKIKIAKAGLGYLKYFTPEGMGDEVKVHIASGQVQGYFDPERHDKAMWNQLISSPPHAYMDVVGKYAHLTYPVSRLRNCSDIHRLVEVYDSICSLQHELMGLQKYGRMFKNRMYFHVVYGDAYMYATSFRTAYHDNTMVDLVDPVKVRSTAVWGPAHEVGHCNQTRPGLRWTGTTEVTTNIHSMQAQFKFGIPTRLQSEDGGFRYRAGMSDIIAKRVPHNEHPDVFCKLIPFWQLQQYASQVAGKSDFYADLHEMVRTNPDKTKQGDNQLQFARFACDAMGEDLSDFFEAWGFFTPVNFQIDDYGVANFTVTQSEIDQTKASIGSKGYPKPKRIVHYFHDDLLNVFVSGDEVQQGTATISANRVTMSNWRNVCVYEVFDGEKMVMISHQHTFTLPENYTNLRVKAVSVTGVRHDISF